MKLIPINNELDQNVRSKVQKHAALSDVEKFIDLYNTGFLAKNSNLVKDLCQEIEKAYLNVSFNGRYLIVLSEAEAITISTVELLKLWGFISALKGLSRQMLEEGFDQEDLIIFKKTKVGKPYIIDPKNDKKTILHWSNRKLADTHDGIIYNNPFLIKVQEDYSENGSVVAFKLKNLKEIDDSFIFELKDFLQKNAINGNEEK